MLRSALLRELAALERDGNDGLTEPSSEVNSVVLLGPSEFPGCSAPFVLWTIVASLWLEPGREVERVEPSRAGLESLVTGLRSSKLEDPVPPRFVTTLLPRFSPGMA